jgi:flagellar M-ring protein FliF
MEQLTKQLKELPGRVVGMPTGTKVLLGALAALVVGVAVAVVAFSSSGDSYQYAFTNLSAEDSAEAAQALKAANVPFRLEAGGAALAVPASKVYDARLLLATAGLPRGGGVGFELFDRGDLGVSEFTQKVNLRRAIEGELARTISRFSEVRSARVHISLSEKGLYREEDKKASAAVVLNLQQGRSLGERELAGVRHLVSSAVPGLPADAVTVVDGRGAVLSGDAAWDDPAAVYQRKLERDLEQRVVSLLEPVVGAGAVIARITAVVDSSQVSSNAEVVDPELSALKSERTLAQNQSQTSTSGAGVAGAAANTPLLPVAGQGAGDNRGTSSTQDNVRNFEVTKTTTATVTHLPRLQRISVAILLDGAEGKVRSEAEVLRLGDLARRAVGFDEQRGDQLQISSELFGKATDEAPKPVVLPPTGLPWWAYVAAGAVAFLLLGAVFFLARRKRPVARANLVLRPGASVSEIEAAEAIAANPAALPVVPGGPALPDPSLGVRDRARELAAVDPTKAAHLLRAWIAADTEQREAPRG